MGSLLRPLALRQARADHEAGAVSASDLKEIEDRSVDIAIATQETIGLPVVTDGEMRRGFYAEAMFGDFDGIRPIESVDRFGNVSYFQSETEDPVEYAIPLAVTERLTRKRMSGVEEFAYARAKARVPVKITMPTPLIFAVMWDPKHSTDAYPDVYSYLEHAAELLRQEAVELAALGCQYIQLDMPELTLILNDRSREDWEKMGLPADWLMNDGMTLVDSVIAGIPEVQFGLHICRGNHASKWLHEGGYGAISEVFERLPHFDRLLLEYDTDRAGGFEPLETVPTDKTVVLGLVSTKTGELEDPDAVLARIEEASTFFPREQLSLSTQCGFASTEHGNSLSESDQEAKLQLVSAVAERAWSNGEAAA